MANFQNKYFYDSDNNATSIFKYLADPTGVAPLDKNAIGDYSVTAADFEIQPGVGQVYVLESLTVEVTADKNSISAPLTNGVLLEVTDSSDVQILDLTDGLPIQSNADWKRIGFDVDLQEALNGNKRTVSFRLDFEKVGRPIILTNQEKFKAVLNDDFTALDSQRFFVKGFEGFGATTAGVNTSVWG